ncbi:MAG: hypothetical protein AAGB01_04600 [Cyanobacteria bacterium P01_F01_bin.42]
MRQNNRQVHWRTLLLSLVLCLTFIISGCQSEPPSPYADVQAETTQRGAPKAVARDATQGSEFNQFFPDAADGFERVFTQEKKGFAEAKLKKDGQNMAMLSISDTSSLPNAASKYDQATESIAGYPAVEIGNTQTAILVAERYQVKVLSRDQSFDQENRQDWIQRFNLSELAELK